ncbi:MAG: tetratricopeptide repeat protein [Anaerolineae bacterium]
MSHYRRALQIVRELGGRRAEGMYLGNIAFALWHVGEYASALDYAEQALDIARKVGDRNEEARAHINAGRALYHLGRLEAAERRLRTAVTLGRQVDQAEKFEDTALQQTFLKRVEVNRQIVAAVKDRSIQSRSMVER